jgi:alkylation response protein AidB-like acyl-CoA dehydrogenase
MTALPTTVEEARSAFRHWLDDNRTDLERFRQSAGDVADVSDRLRSLQRMLFDAGWIRLGWPESVGGLRSGAIDDSVVPL